MKKNILLLFFLYLCLLIQAQEKQIFSETFTDNHNNWPSINKKGKKASVSNNSYDLSNYAKNEYDDLMALNSTPLDSMKDIHITMDVEDLHLNDKEYDGRNGSCSFVIGARDEHGGYFITQRKKYFSVALLQPNGTLGLYSADIEIANPEHFEMRIEHNRWKFYGQNDNEIVNIPAFSLYGNKVGIMLFPSSHYSLKKITIAEKEKDIIKTDFNLALFMFAYQKLLCSAWNMFKDDVGAQYGTPKDSTWYCKTNVPGFGFHTFLFIHKNTIELLTSRKFNFLDEAYAYYDQALSGIKLTKDTCLELSNNTAQLSTMDFYKNHFVQFDSRRSGFRDDHAQKVEGNILLGLSKVNSESAWLVEFHIILYLSNKVF